MTAINLIEEIEVSGKGGYINLFIEKIEVSGKGGYINLFIEKIEVSGKGGYINLFAFDCLQTIVLPINLARM